jgi:hypothetical protein
MTNISKVSYFCLVLGMTVLPAACGPWYAKWGIKSNSELHSTQAIPSLVKAVSSSSCRDVYYAGEILGQIGRDSQTASDALKQAIYGPCGDSYGYYMAQWLAQTGSYSEPALIELANSPNATMRYNAVASMAMLTQPSPEVIAVLAAKIASSDPLDVDAQQEAFTVLGKHGTQAKGALPALEKMATNETWGWYAIQCIGKIGYPAKSTMDLLKLLSEQGPDATKDIALETYKKLKVLGFAQGVAANPNPLPETKVVQPVLPKVKKKTNIIIAVFDVEDVSNVFKKRVLNQLTIYLMNQVTIHAGFRVIPREQLKKRIAEQKGASYKKCFDESCQIELGRALAAQKTLSTQLLKVGKQCMVVSNIFDLKTETTEKAASAKTNCTETALVGALEAIAQQIAQ